MALCTNSLRGRTFRTLPSGDTRPQLLRWHQLDAICGTLAIAASVAVIGEVQLGGLSQIRGRLAMTRMVMRISAVLVELPVV